MGTGYSCECLSVFNGNVISSYAQLKHLSYEIYELLNFFFFKEPKHTFSQNPSVCQVSTAADKDSGNLGPVPSNASHLMHSLVQYLLSLLVSLLSFAFFALPVKFLQSGVSFHDTFRHYILKLGPKIHLGLSALLLQVFVSQMTLHMYFSGIEQQK